MCLFWIHKGYFVLKNKMVINASLKAFWYTINVSFLYKEKVNKLNATFYQKEFKWLIESKCFRIAHVPIWTGEVGVNNIGAPKMRTIYGALNA